MKKKIIILDSYALLAYFEYERGADNVAEKLLSAALDKVELVMCLVNWGEVYYIVLREYGEKLLHEILGAIREMPVRIIPADEAITRIASTLKARYPVSYADTFAAALAKHLNGALLTGDGEFKKLEKEISIEWI